MQLTATATLALLSSGALAIPFPFPQQKTFSVAVGRHAGDILQDLEHLLQPRAGTTGSAPKIQLNTYWYVNATAGGQPLTWTVDTGSSVSWALSPNTSAQQNSGQLIYDPTKSKTASRIAGETYNIRYGSGNIGSNGNGWSDQICVGTACATSNIGVAQNVSTTPGTFRSGLLGLSFGAASAYTPKQLPTFMEDLQKSLAQPVFVTNFRGDGTGSLDFGFVNSSLYTGSLQTIPLDNSTGFWQSNSVGYFAGGKQLGGNLTMIIDTGSPVIQVSNDTVNAYYAQMKNARYVNNRWQYPCSNASLLPDFSLRFSNGATAKIAGPRMQWGTVDGSNCTTYLQATGGLGTMGDAWFDTQIVVFNQAVPSMQFAPKAF